MNQRTSLDDITSFITSPQGGTDDDDTGVLDTVLGADDKSKKPEDTSEDDLFSDDGLDDEDNPDAIDEEDLDADDTSDEEDSDEDEAEQEGDDDDLDYLDISDEDLIEVKIDGEVVYRTVEDAKKALSGEGAIEKRLKEATVTRKKAVASYEAGLTELETSRQHIIDGLTAIEEVAFAAMVPPPNEAIRQTNPGQYLQQLDRFRADQKRISDLRDALAENVGKLREQAVETARVRRKRVEAELLDDIPELHDPEKRAGIMKGILTVTDEYGFSLEDVGRFFDSRAFKMAYDLSKLKGKKPTVTVEDIKKKVKGRKPRRLRSGVAQRVNKAKASKKAQDQVRERARKTGKVDDITRMIMTPGKRSN